MDKKADNKIYPVILAGGSGTRLWPLSRELSPKQLLEIKEETSLIKMAVNRCRLITDNTPTIVTTAKQLECIKTDLAGIKVNYIKEPSAKNTAPAITLATATIHVEDPEAIMAILPSDQFLDEIKLAEAIKKAASVADKQKTIVLIGIKPTRPETGYGYIQIDNHKTQRKEVYKVKKFKEKPNHNVAKKYVKSGDFLWNAGMFVARAETLKKEIINYMPELSVLFDKKTDETIIKNKYEKIASASIEYGVIEKLKNLYVVKTNMYWNDLGNWKAIHEISEKDVSGNHYRGRHVGFENNNTIIYNNSSQLVATIGLNNLAVINTEDAILVCDKEKSQDIKKIVEELKKNECNELIEHKTTKKPWGKYTILDEGEGFKVKFLHLSPGAKISLQKHKHRAEHWVVIKGLAKITIHDKEGLLNPNESVFVPAGTKHRLENIGIDELIVVEVATGLYIEEDDIERLDDVYSRER
ncbi:MAG: mannose-1-phosphate guanylyltransferase/mannose-6-phosphate isomerase [Patescibacteria group bacterium]